MEKVDLRAAVKAAYEAIDAKFGQEITVLEIGGLSTIAEYFIIVTANNAAQGRAIADAAEEALFKSGVKLKHSEGYRTSKWILLDFGVIIAHIFTKEDREFYHLEKLWGDATLLSPQQLG